MRRTDVLITQARMLSRNSANADGTKSISDEEILQYLNDAQDRMQNLISAKKNVAKIFCTQQLISVVNSQEAYSVPDRVLMNKQIEQVEFSATGLLSDYVLLEKRNFINRDTNTTNYPNGYIKRGNQLLLQPTPSLSQGTLRVTYERDLDDLDIPRGVVSTITTGTAVSFAALILNTSADAYETTTPGWATQQYCCIVSPYGVRRAYNVPISSYNTGSNTLVPTGSLFTYSTNDVQVTAGDVAVFNQYTTTFSQLPDSCERYLIHYAAMELFHRDSSDDFKKQRDLVGAMEEDILTALASQTSEIQYIPTLDRYEWF